MKKSYIHETQGSGKAGSRTSDHLLIIKFLIDKYVKQKGKQLFACFVDLMKAYDTVPRTKLFYTLLKEYSIGGNFLKILQQVYKGNQVFIKLTDGLLQPINTTIGLKQGCVFSPILFNLFINKISNIFDDTCVPVEINNVKISSLLWADDLLLVSQTAEGLQNSINKMDKFYQSLELKINMKKTKVMIFNKRGIKMDKKFTFSINTSKLEITDQYQYLGLKLRPSGSMTFAVQELCDKASRAWFSISNIIFRNKRMKIDQALGIFDSLVTPVATYVRPLCLPYIIPQKNFKSAENILDFWDKFEAEKLNQKCCRMLLSVNKKTSRLALLGELARYPILVASLSQCLNYKLSLLTSKTTSCLLGHVMTEMADMCEGGHDTWLTRVTKIEKLLNLPTIRSTKFSGKKITASLKSKFDVHWLDKINQIKLGPDDLDHTKLRTYKTFKASFTREPYLDLIRNRNQRSFLSRLRVSSHNLAIERGRYTRPITPIGQRTCSFCVPRTPQPAPPCSAPPWWTQPPRLTSSSEQKDDEFHFLLKCPIFNIERNCFLGKM